MTLTSGTRLGPYEIQSAIGAGGMGEVYRARDTRLDRSVAIKVLPPEFSADPDRRARFEREAKTIAGLNHPHICTLHDVGEHDGSTYLVMEHLQGQTLADRLAKGPLALDQALTVATEIAEALSAAHRQGVIHRDLKPGNVMLTKTGAKLLDFGLAKLKGHGEQAAAASLASAPTQTKPLTSEGAIVGTLQYMAPEQVEGKPADARTDLWALGAILYEMLTGKRAFEGASAASLIGNIMNSQPPALTMVQPLTPPALDRLVRQCLAKAPEDRPDTAHDVANDLRWMRETAAAAAPTGAGPRRRRILRTGFVLAAVLAGAAIGAAVMWLLRSSPATPSRLEAELPVRPADDLNAGGARPLSCPTPGGSRTALVWTPDGHALVFVGRREGVQQLYVLRRDARQARPLDHTENAQVPAVSPDGQWVAFFAGGMIKKVPLSGGRPIDLAPIEQIPPSGMVWDGQGGLFMGREDGRIWAISAEGNLAPVTTLRDEERRHVLPSLLPGGRVLLYSVRKREYSWGDEEVVAQRLPDGKPKRLLTNAVDARYVPATGHLLFMRRGSLYGVPFDPEVLELRGAQVPVLDEVVQALTSGFSSDVTGAGQFAIGATGTLAWLSGPVIPYPQTRLVTVDRRGQVTELPADARSYGPVVRLSPDQRRLAVTVRTLTEEGLWIYDLTRRAPLFPLTIEGEASWPMWGSSGLELYFAWLKDGRSVLARQAADGATPPRALRPGLVRPSSPLPDGRFAAVARGPAPSSYRIVVVTVEKEETRVEPLGQPLDSERSPEFSRDGRWLLYMSNASGRDEIYVRPFPGLERPVPVSTEGGSDPAWHSSGREILFLSPSTADSRSRVMAATFTPGAEPPPSSPAGLFSYDNRDLAMSCRPIRCYDVALGGQRFYAVRRSYPAPPVVTHINISQNWFEVLKAKVPTGR